MVFINIINENIFSLYIKLIYEFFGIFKTNITLYYFFDKNVNLLNIKYLIIKKIVFKIFIILTIFYLFFIFISIISFK